MWIVFGLWGMLTFWGIGNGNHPVIAGFLAGCLTFVIVAVYWFVRLVWAIPV
jgi:hypothetical protein